MQKTLPKDQAAVSGPEKTSQVESADDKVAKKPPKRPKDKEAIAARKKAKKEKIQSEAAEAAKNKVDRALAYLRDWKKAPDQWKFQKNQHTWLLKNWRSIDKISDKKFKRLLKYLTSVNSVNSSGGVLRLKKEAQTYIETHKEDDDEEEGGNNLAIYQRARQIIQWVE